MGPLVGDRAPVFEGLLCDGEIFRAKRISLALDERGAVLIFDDFVFSAIARN